MNARWHSLKVGDRVRLLRIPEADLKQRERELRDNVEMAGWTADTLERIIAADPIVTIDEVDEYDVPWFRYELLAADGSVEYHHLTIMDDDSWELVVE